MLPNKIIKVSRQRQKPKNLMGQSGSVAAWILVLLLAIGGVVGIAYMNRDLLGETKLGQLLHLKTATTSKDIYYCPMHPQYHSDRPGTCPICNMNLEKMPAGKESTTRPEAPVAKEGQAPAERKILYWTDPMIPGFKSDKPGKSPMGMDLSPVYEEATPPAKALPPGSVRIASQTQQLIGVEYGEVTEQPLSKTILTVGRLTYDETKIARIQPRIDGWIDSVFVDFAGKLVKKGQPLFSLYSPELFSAQQELLIAKRTMESLANSEFKEVSANAES